MSTFIYNDFLLQSESAKALYHDYAEQEPIFDFHCHLSPKAIAENSRFSDLTELWLSGDHYKWRLMRAEGIPESHITGDAPAYEKFLAWAKTISRSIGNPLYHWTHLELLRYFGEERILNEQTAPEIWASSKRRIAEPDFTVREILRQSHVAALATTDDPLNDLQYHRQLASDSDFHIRVLPTFRPEKALRVAAPEFREWVQELGKLCKVKIDSVQALTEALEQRAEFFRDAGCLGSDQSFGSPDFTVRDPEAAQRAFVKGMEGLKPSAYEINAYESMLMLFLGKLYHRLGWVMQLHLGALRNNSTRMMEAIGPDSGFDSIGDTISAASLSALLNGLDASDELPRTIIFTLNPNDNEKIAALAGCFPGTGIRSKVQLGAAWWFQDHRDGMAKQMETLANTGMLSNFTGMLTDSRSFLSYPRHEYFRRILCALVGGWMDKGEIPDDQEQAGKIIQDICFGNAVNFYGLELPDMVSLRKNTGGNQK